MRQKEIELFQLDILVEMMNSLFGDKKNIVIVLLDMTIRVKSKKKNR